MATMHKKAGASKGKGKGKSTKALKDLDAKRVAGKVKGGITITKSTDISSQKLFQESLIGKATQTPIK